MTNKHKVLLFVVLATITVLSVFMTSCGHINYARANRRAQHTSCDRVQKDFVGYGPGGW